MIHSPLPLRLIVPLLIVLLAAAPGAGARISLPRAWRSFAHGDSGGKAGRIKVCPDLVKASRLAEKNARSRSVNRCWRYVKRALVAAGVVDRYPGGISAKYAGQVLTRDHGFTRLPNISRPQDAPEGAVLVYGGKGHGHVEFRTPSGYVSDFRSSKHSKRPLTGVYVKPTSR